MKNTKSQNEQEKEQTKNEKKKTKKLKVQRCTAMISRELLRVFGRVSSRAAPTSRTSQQARLLHPTALNERYSFRVDTVAFRSFCRQRTSTGTRSQVGMIFQKDKGYQILFKIHGSGGTFSNRSKHTHTHIR